MEGEATFKGKFGSKKFNETHIIDAQNIDEETHNKWFEDDKEDYKMYTRDNRIFVINRETKVDKAYQIPIYATYTTAYARLLMHSHILALEKRGIPTLYMDTDSLFICGEMKTSKELGEMSLDYDCDEALFVKPKMYMYSKGSETICKLKGVPRMTRKKFIDILEGRSVSYQTFMKTKSGIRRGIAPNTVTDVEKHLNLEDNKRLWKKEFNPYVLEDSEPIEVDLLCETIKQEKEVVLKLRSKAEL